MNPFKPLTTPLPQIEWYEIQLAPTHPEYIWEVPSRFNAHIMSKFEQIRWKVCINFLKNASIKNTYDAIEELTDETKAKTQEEKKVMKSLRSLTAKEIDLQFTSITREQVEKYLDLFYYFNNDEVYKEQLNLLCRPKGQTPTVIEAFDLIDYQRGIEVFNFFYNTAFSTNSVRENGSDGMRTKEENDTDVTSKSKGRKRSQNH